MNQQPVNYGNAEARGKIRAWKNKLAERYRVVDAVGRASADRHSPLFAACQNMVRRSSRKGRERAFEKMQQALAPAGGKLETLHLGGKKSWALWSILKPRIPVTVDASDESGFNQFCVTVNYVMAGYLPAFDAVGTMDGFWGLEVPDHALGRGGRAQRARCKPETIIRDAHRNLLDLPATLFSDGLFRCTNAVFSCGLRCWSVPVQNICRRGCLPRRRLPAMQVIASTWIDDNQLHEDPGRAVRQGRARRPAGWMAGWLPRPNTCGKSATPRTAARC